MGYTITLESFASLASYWANESAGLKWGSTFVLPAWMEVWWQTFGSEAELYLCAGWKEDKIIGIAPLQINGQTIAFVGSPNVCDYLDFVLACGTEKEFFTLLLDNLLQRGISSLDLRPLRPDSTVLTVLVGIARDRGYEVICKKNGVSVEMDLPATWAGYMAILTKKQRHEVRRKLRRLWEAGDVQHLWLGISRDQVRDCIGTFLKLFSLSREEKARFMTSQMESFFYSLAGAMAEIGILKFGILKIDTLPVAMTMGFDYNDCHFLYNSAYDPKYNSLSVGLLCKVLSIKNSIECDKNKWDFLQGGEQYKYHIGGREIPLYSCQITMK